MRTATTASRAACPRPALPPYRPDPSEPRHRVRRILGGLGLDEVVLHALIGADDLARSGYDAADPDLIRLANPLAEQHSIMRPVPYPSMLAALAENVRQRRTDPWLFEVGKTYWMGGSRGPTWPRAPAAGDGRPGTPRLACSGRASRQPRPERSRTRMCDPEGPDRRPARRVGAPLPAYRPERGEVLHPHLHPGRSARIVDATARDYGSLGEVHPRVAEAWGLPGRPVIAAINLGALLSLVPQEVDRAAGARRAAGRPRPGGVGGRGHPAGRAAARAARERRAIAGRGTAVRRVSRPAGRRGRVSYAIALRFQPEKAGDEKAVERAMSKLRGALQHHLGAQIR